MAEPQALQDQIDDFRKEIRSESYPMSIGELMNLYDSEELDLHPEFQRFFRWTPLQKTRLIESILLGIPLPAVFLVQREDGVLDVIDGLQRLSTVFQFAGVLRDESHEVVVPPLVLEATKYLPALEGVRWESEDDDDVPTLGVAQRLQFKRSKINLIILERLSDPDAKYELFQRLNTGGSELSDQEVRNCVLIMIKREFYLWLVALADLDDFQNAIGLSERKEQERYDLELVVRYIVMDSVATQGGIRGLRDLGAFLTDQVVELAKDDAYQRDEVGERFTRTLRVIREALSSEAFVPYKAERDVFGGAFSVAAFEAITFGVSQNLDAWEALSAADRATVLRARVISMWSDQTHWRNQTGTGVRAENRLPFVLDYAPTHYAP